MSAKLKELQERIATMRFHSAGLVVDIHDKEIEQIVDILEVLIEEVQKIEDEIIRIRQLTPPPTWVR